MPHCVIEYSNSVAEEVSPKILMQSVFDTVSASLLFSTSTIIVRAQAFESFCLGNDNDGFIHVTIKLLQGHNSKEKARLCHQVVDDLALLQLKHVFISCECLEIHKPSYCHVAVQG